MNNTSSVVLKKPNLNRDRIVADITDKIRNGELRIGDRLPSMLEIRRVYEASQRVVTAALKQLVEDGWLRQPGRGCYYVNESLSQNDIPAISSGSARKEAPPAMEFDETWNGDIVSSNHLKTLELFINDAYPTTIEFWENTIKAFHRRYPEIRVNPIFQRTKLDPESFIKGKYDIAQLSQLDLYLIGKERFLDLPWSVFGLERDALLDIIQKAAQIEKDIIGTPFSISFCYLYANETLREKTNVGVPQNIDELLSTPDPAALARNDAKLLSMPRVGIFFLLANVVSNQASGIHLDTDRLRSILTQIKENSDSLIFYNNVTRELSHDDARFVDGKVVYVMSNCYYAIHLRESQPSFEWKTYPVPADENGSYEAYLTSLAISRETSALNEAIEFVKFATSREIQTNYGLMGGNLPILRSVFEDGVLDQAFPVSISQLTKWLERQRLFIWPLDKATRKIIDDLHYCSTMYWMGKMNLDECVDRIEILFGLYRKTLSDRKRTHSGKIREDA